MSMLRRTLLATAVAAACSSAPVSRRAAPPAPPPAAAEAEDHDGASRAEFARALAKVKPGMPASEVRALLGEPGDVRTERDPGGITAARTVEVWRYGTNGHLTFGTLGTVHVQADGTVQYAFGGAGAPPPDGDFDERELRRLLRLVDAVPSYSGDPDPLPLIQAVNALQRLGKARALAVLDEYLRVSSWLDDPGREGTFLVMRTLFEVPDDPGHLPPMFVGAPAPAAPADPRALPRFPLVIVEDVPFRVVYGYMLAGHPEQPEQHLEWFRRNGVIRERPLAPPAEPLALVETLAGASGTPFLRATGLDDENGRRFILAQGLRLVATAFRERLPDRGPLDDGWRAVRAAYGARVLRWDGGADRYTLDDGSVLPAEPRPIYQRAIFTPAAPGATVRVILERRDEAEVLLELRVELERGASFPKGRLRILDEGGAELAGLDFIGLTAPPNSTAGMVQGSVVRLAEGTKVRAELALDGQPAQTSPLLDPGAR